MSKVTQTISEIIGQPPLHHPNRIMTNISTYKSVDFNDYVIAFCSNDSFVWVRFEDEDLKLRDIIDNHLAFNYKHRYIIKVLKFIDKIKLPRVKIDWRR